MLEWIAVFFCQRFSWAGDRTHTSCIADRLFAPEPPGKPLEGTLALLPLQGTQSDAVDVWLALLPPREGRFLSMAFQERGEEMRVRYARKSGGVDLIFLWGDNLCLLPEVDFRLGDMDGCLEPWAHSSAAFRGALLRVSLWVLFIWMGGGGIPNLGEMECFIPSSCWSGGCEFEPKRHSFHICFSLPTSKELSVGCIKHRCLQPRIDTSVKKEWNWNCRVKGEDNDHNF